MSLEPGTKLGPYEIIASIGAGGMGEVYRARDTKLGRDVAIKVLPESFAADPERLARFEREAQAVAALSHPNILAIYDFGSEEGRVFAVTELLEGDTLRERVGGGALPERKAIDYASQLARGLAAAHEKGITHRDLKPENLFVTHDGRVKILDFGLAKTEEEPSDDSQTSAPTRAAGTKPGVVLGTVGYMSPEQVRGAIADHRSDIFAFGAVLYEMLAGRRAFQRETGAETMTAILKEDPVALDETAPALERIVDRCLEKNPGERFQSAYDLAFAIESLSRESGPAKVDVVTPRTTRPLAVTTLVTLLVAGAYWVGRNAGPAEAPFLEYERLTFRRGAVYSGQFVPGSRDVIYSATWDGGDPQIYSTLPGTRESRPLGLESADVASVSPNGEMAVLKKTPGRVTWDQIDGAPGTLAVSTPSGGAVREITEDVLFADWAEVEGSFAVVRRVGQKAQVELPIGSPVYETNNVLLSARVSPDGKTIAFGEKAKGFASSWSVSFLEIGGDVRRYDTGFRGDRIDLAWSPDGREVWFNMYQGATLDLHAMSRGGVMRTIARPPISLRILDVSRDGRILVARTSFRAGVRGMTPGDTAERDFSWLDGTEADAISSDGKTLLLTEYGEGGGEGWSVYLRGTDGASAVRLGDGQAFDLSPDEKWALTMPQAPVSLVLLPTGAGTPVVVDNDIIVDYVNASFVSDASEIVFAGVEQGAPLRWFRQAVPDGEPQPITGGVELFKGSAILGSSPVSPDGTMMAAAHDGVLALYPLDGGEPKDLPGVAASVNVIRFSPDGRSLYYEEAIDHTKAIRLVDIETGRQELWKTIARGDGMIDIYAIQISDDGESYFYTFQQAYSDLYLVGGLH